VTITPEGFRRDAKQAVLDFIALVDAERAAKAIHDARLSDEEARVLPVHSTVSP
jgi:hypothetical protein